MIALRPRERNLAIGLVAGVAAMSLYGLVVAPRLARIRTLQRVIPEKQQELRDLSVKSRQVMTLSSQLAVIRQAIDAEPRIEFLPVIASIVSRQGLQSHLLTLEQAAGGLQAESGDLVVELSLRKVTFKQVLGLLQEVQSQVRLARVATLHLSRSVQEPGLLDAAITLLKPQSTAEAAQGSRQPTSK
jgi:type II secretory pathway component PulM